MAYRLDPTRPLPAELDRIVDEQLGRAARRLEGHVDDGDVHDVRKRIKKTRSLLRLARAGLGDDRVEALVVDVLGEGSGLVRRLLAADVEAVDVATQGLGAAAAAADVVVLEASAVGPDAFVGVAGSRAAAAVARHDGRPVWLVAGVGRLVPQRVWDALSGLVDAAAEPWEADDELVPLALVDQVVGPTGPQPVADALRRTDCPVAAELFVSL
ncbi:MAG: hypothetical protein KDB35_11540 [Acidimicrobiales bacterium]|nr:hypothetical protein [Acidimicrobiales bacterium]